MAISPLPIHAILSYGMLANPKNWHFPMTSQPDFLSAINQLFSQLAETQTPYTLVGGIAMLVYVQGRNTQDIDFIMNRLDADRIGLLVSEENQDFARASYQGTQVDLLLTHNPLFKLVQDSYSQMIDLDRKSIQIATPEGLAILKLYALPSLYRQGQFDRAAIYETDILQLTLNHSIDLNQSLKIVAPHLIASDQTEISSIISDIHQRLQRMQQSSQNNQIES
jgi:hypothetical protein